MTMFRYITLFTAWNFTTYLFTTTIYLLRCEANQGMFHFRQWSNFEPQIRIIRMNARYIGLDNYASTSIINRQCSWLTMTHTMYSGRLLSLVTFTRFCKSRVRIFVGINERNVRRELNQLRFQTRSILCSRLNFDALKLWNILYLCL